MAKERFDHTSIEPNAQAKWEALKLHEIDLATAKDPYYLLFEFPYPSGDLHIGHWYAFALTDIYARLLRMQGKDVLFPIGFDAFGLPAENAAIRNNVDPKQWTYENMDRMRSQIRSMGTSVDWSKEVVTCDPSYYQFTQWLFAKLHEKGLVERKASAVKWCPKDATVLANEQVVDGTCERCGTAVEEKRLTQWFMKITEYVDRLLSDLDPLPWREEIKEAQRAWIGKSEGAKITFNISGAGQENAGIAVFTTRPDTLFGVTYLVIAPEHPQLPDLIYHISNADAVREYVDATKKKTELERSENKEKTGVRLDGVNAINPATGEEIPVFVADYVLGSYGTGAVMAVPAHDERDFEFARKMNLPIKQVIESSEGLYTGDGPLVNSGAFTGKQSREAYWDIVGAVGGERTTNYRLRDWLVSRQRYWGCPIPMVYDPEGNPHYVGDENLPWLLPTDVDFTPTGKPPLASSKELHERVTRLFGEGWTPEYDTLDTFVDSSWYFYRYLAPSDTERFSKDDLLKKWMPVQRYSGGSEHTTMHLLYARFFHKALHDLGLVPGDEPFIERFNRGIILGPDGAKMSKSKGNVVNPDEFVQKYGSDAVRMYLAFIGPYNEPGSYPWNLDGVEAMRRFLDRVDRLSEKATADSDDDAVKKAIAVATQKVGDDIARFKLNTAISALMSLMNDLEKASAITKDSYLTLLRLLAPSAPHLAEHLYEGIGGEGSIHAQPWPIVDQGYLSSSEALVIVQINGKKRGEITLSKSAGEEEAVEAAKGIPLVAKTLEASTSRIIYVPGRILNIVAQEEG